MSHRVTSSEQANSDLVSGLCILGIFVTGVASLFVALIAVLNDLDITGAGLALLAAATAFGLLANALLRT